MKKISYRLLGFATLIMVSFCLQAEGASKKASPQGEPQIIEWQALTEQQQQILETVRPRWDELMPNQQRQLVMLTGKWDTIAEDHRARLLQRLSMPRQAQQRSRLQEDARGSDKAGNRHQSARRDTPFQPNRPVDDRLRMREKLQNMTPEERKAYAEARREAAVKARQEQAEKMQAMTTEREAMREKMENMTPEERRAFMQEYRETLQAQRQAEMELRKTHREAAEKSQQ